MSEAYVHGFNLVLEGVRQMPRHVDGAGRGRGVLPGDERRGRAHERGAVPPMTADDDATPASCSPISTTRSSAPFWAGTARGELLVQTLRVVRAAADAAPADVPARAGRSTTTWGRCRAARHDLVVRRPPSRRCSRRTRSSRRTTSIVVALDEDPTIRFVGNLVERPRRPRSTRSTPPRIEIGEPVAGHLRRASTTSPSPAGSAPRASLSVRVVGARTRSTRTATRGETGRRRASTPPCDGRRGDIDRSDGVDAAGPEPQLVDSWLGGLGGSRPAGGPAGSPSVRSQRSWRSIQ